MILFSDLDVLVKSARRRASRQYYDGSENMALMRECASLFAINPLVSALMIYTRDIGHHAHGWWKNPDYERCLHLSISFCMNPSGRPLPYDRKQGEHIAKAFFGSSSRLLWVEPPYSAYGRHCEVYHHRLFCDPSWSPILPRGEVYSRENTPSGWLSFSELYGWSPARENAPFLKAASE